MVMPPRSCSAAMRSIRRELQRRRPKKPLSPTKSAAKKPLAQPRREDRSDPAQEPRLAHREVPSSTMSDSRGAAAPADHVPVSSPPLPRSSVSSAGSACRSTPTAAAHLKPGTQVGVRTRTTKLKTGQVLVLWLKAMVVSPTHEGYEVVYNGNWPLGDPYAAVHVARHHVRLIKTSTPPTTPPPSLPAASAASSCASATTATVAAARKKEMRHEPRPTTAEKKLRLIRNLALEMERQATSFLTGY